MNIIVCVKAVKSSLVSPAKSGDEEIMINPYDLYALKDVLRLKASKNITIICLGMGPKNAESVMIKCLAMGADHAVLLCDPAFGGADTVATTYALQSAIKKIDENALIVCGGQSIDGETGQVVFGIAERLKRMCITNVKNIMETGEDYIILDTVSTDFIKKIRVKTPVVISYCDFITARENISLLNLKKAKKKGVELINAEQLGVDVNKCGVNGSRTKVLNICAVQPERKDNVVYVHGTSNEKAALIHGLLTKQ